MIIFNEKKILGLLGLDLTFEVDFGIGFLANFHNILEFNIKMQQQLFHWLRNAKQLNTVYKILLCLLFRETIFFVSLCFAFRETKKGCEIETLITKAEPLSGSLDDCVEIDWTFYITKLTEDGIFFRLFLSTEPSTYKVNHIGKHRTRATVTRVHEKFAVWYPDRELRNANDYHLPRPNELSSK
jgi:hypothetical protein